MVIQFSGQKCLHHSPNYLHNPTALRIKMLIITRSEKGKIFFKDMGEDCETVTEGQEGSQPTGILSSVTTSVTSS